jgi:hypothetical protein
MWKALALAGALAMACGGAAVGQGPDQATLDRMRADREARGIFNKVKVDLDARTIEFTYGSPELRRMSFDEFESFVRARLANQTHAFEDPFHGYQIEYFSPDGRVALWYPNNTKAVLGTYATKQSLEPVNMFGDTPGVLVCFVYQQDSYNPMTGQAGGREECRSAYALIAGIRGKREGDVFNLLSGTVPHRMKPAKPPKWPDGEKLIPARAPHR